MRYDVRNAAVISKLDPVARDLFSALLKALENVGEDILLTSGIRTLKEQNALFAQGRTKPGKIVTYAKGDESLHTWGCAIDFVPVDSKGLEQWKAKDRFRFVGEKAKGFGCEWGGDWSKPDMPHLQYTQGLTIKSFRSGKRLQKAEQKKNLKSLLKIAGEALDNPRVAATRKNRLRRFIERVKALLG